jgi:hypothetical protein
MGTLFKGLARKAGAILLLSLGLAAAGTSLSGCAAGTAGGPSPGSFPECMIPSNPQPWWETYPCNLFNAGGSP